MLTAVYAFVVLLTGSIGIVCLKIGVKQWHGEGRPLSSWLTGPFMDSESKLGIDRAIFAFGAMWLFLGIACAGSIIINVQHGHNIISLMIQAVGVVGFLFFGILNAGIISLNRPRIMVPPHLRNHPGAIAARRNNRKRHYKR